MSVSSIPPVNSPAPPSAPAPKPVAAIAPRVAPVRTDSDGDHDGTVGSKVDVKA